MSNAPINKAPIDKVSTTESPINEASNSSGNGFTDKQVQQVLLTLLLGGTVVSFSNSALNPAIPVFMSVFDVDIVMGGWVLNAYVLAMSVGLMLSGYLNKKFPFKHVYLAAIFGFMLGSVIGMLASSMSFVIIARAIQGLSGGLIIPLSIGMLYQIYPQQQHGRVMAIWGIVIMMSLAFGPLVGAYLVEQFAWWTLFAITLPLSVAVMAMVWRLIPDMRSHDQETPFDIIGFVSLIIWLLAMMIWLSTLKIDFTHGISRRDDLLKIVALGALSILFLLSAVAWWAYERRQRHPLLNVRLFNNKTYLHSNIISISQTVGLMLCLLLLPVLIQDVMGESALWTGVVLMVATLVASITTHYAGKMVDKQGARGIGIVGIAISALSTLMLAWCLYQPTLWLLILTMSVRGVGVGLAYLPTTTVGFSSLPKDSVTEGAALNNISRRIISTIVITLTTLYIHSRSAQLLAAGSDVGIASAIQEILVIIALMLLFTLPSACKLPRAP
ncbi:DHA2 family efflux MFS transporter permease subunit [Psychrobacter sp. 4Dc]|jgi:EmrB/QacA subfamily drug resistance transporter|uniref:DHA2 family efflux MFS transporter permease subunit n=1 Tax=Psychrobacter TaxID=497 RepID=UPI000CAC7B34|nr:DHA2 family efflux MFS transporter permease subunit [Psychrobacter sp. 4Dc]PKH65917.1 MFS transporter [Psychrobacter sp. 4Dc]